MGYAGQNYGSGGAYDGSGTGPHPVSGSGQFATEHAAAAVVLGCLAALIAIRMGFRSVSISGVTGGLVK